MPESQCLPGRARDWTTRVVLDISRGRVIYISGLYIRPLYLLSLPGLPKPATGSDNYSHSAKRQLRQSKIVDIPLKRRPTIDHYLMFS
ncbi:hypothetical protein VFPPC_15975 [Pochonia chlamydosporia 170]|uniref:Uncharacterized protein n=1 Tax=Pochonia chlamydosporia 170 TaxID=1380566 RepID=A0A179FLY9_METCM|nr:hypothetical protein VFPPC_15975 [Pochonia chlamydosporia 170]OAQ66019.1 hypothetical protein VFPPC_15975 [Pochonia chlamydosporia 170]